MYLTCCSTEVICPLRHFPNQRRLPRGLELKSVRYEMHVLQGWCDLHMPSKTAEIIFFIVCEGLVADKLWLILDIKNYTSSVVSNSVFDCLFYWRHTSVRSLRMTGNSNLCSTVCSDQPKAPKVCMADPFVSAIHRNCWFPSYRTSNEESLDMLWRLHAVHDANISVIYERCHFFSLPGTF